MKQAALLLCTLLLAALAGCQLGGKAIILPKAGNITAIQVETLEGESLSLTQEEDIARLLEVLNTGWSIAGVRPRPAFGGALRDHPPGKPGRRHGAVLLQGGGRHLGGAALHRHFPPGGQPGKRSAPARLSMGNQKKAQP